MFGVNKEKEEKKFRICVDMDGTIAEWRNIDLKLDEQEEADPATVASKLFEILTQRGYYESLRPIHKVLHAVDELTKNPDVEVFIITCYLPNTEKSSPYQEKNSWLDDLLPQIDKAHRIFVPNGEDKTRYVPGGVKSTDFLLDDYTKNLNDWEAAGGVGIKILNGINHTKGTWAGSKISAMQSHEDIMEKILSVINGNVVKDMEVPRTMPEPYEPER